MLQGSNANSVIALPANAGNTVAPGAQTQLCWHRERHWVLPEAQALLHTASIGSTGCLMFCSQAVSLRMGFLWDHQVRFPLHACSFSACERGRKQAYILLVACA